MVFCALACSVRARALTRSSTQEWFLISIIYYVVVRYNRRKQTASLSKKHITRKRWAAVYLIEYNKTLVFVRLRRRDKKCSYKTSHTHTHEHEHSTFAVSINIGVSIVCYNMHAQQVLTAIGCRCYSSRSYYNTWNARNNEHAVEPNGRTDETKEQGNRRDNTVAVAFE